MQDAAREKHVVDALLLLIRHGELGDSEAALQNAEEALHVITHALQSFGGEQVVSLRGYFEGSIRISHW